MPFCRNAWIYHEENYMTHLLADNNKRHCRWDMSNALFPLSHQCISYSCTISQLRTMMLKRPLKFPSKIALPLIVFPSLFRDYSSPSPRKCKLSTDKMWSFYTKILHEFYYWRSKRRSDLSRFSFLQAKPYFKSINKRILIRFYICALVGTIALSDARLLLVKSIFSRWMNGVEWSIRAGN